MDALLGQEAKANFALWRSAARTVRTMAVARMVVISAARALAEISAGGGSARVCHGGSGDLQRRKSSPGSSEAEGNGGKLATPDAR